MRQEAIQDETDAITLPEVLANAIPNPRAANIAPALGEISIQPRTELDLKLVTGNIRLGQKKMPFRLPKEQNDYSDYRYRFLVAMAASQAQVGELHPELKPLEIWAAIGEEGKFPAELMIAIKRWLPTLTYRGKRLVEGNGKRGRGATYWVNQAFFLNVDDRIAEQLPSQEPLPDPAEIYEAVRHLAQFDFAIREHGVLEMEPGLEMSLQAVKPDYAQLRGSGVDLREFRAEAAAKMSKLLTDLDYISRYKDSLDKDSPEYGLLRYIYDLTPNERFFVERLTRGQVIPHRMGGELRLEAVDERGMIIATVLPRGTIDALETEQEPGEADVEPASRHIEHWHDEDVVFDRQQQNRPGSGEIKFKNQLEAEMIGLVEAVAETTAMTFLERFRSDKIYSREHLLNAFPKLSIASVVSARDNNILPGEPRRTASGRPGMSLEDVIKVTLYSDGYLQNVVTARKYKKQIHSIIKEVIDRCVQSVEDELSGLED